MEGRRGAKQNSTSRWHRSSVLLRAVATATLEAHTATRFKLDVSGFTPEDAKHRHVGESGGPPEVEVVSIGTNEVLAARGTIRVPYNARKIFENICNPEENRRIFEENTASVNLRRLIEEDKVCETRLFEVSKTGRWNLLGVPITFESTVFAMEDWRKNEVSFQLKKQGAMKHMSGFWRIVPVSEDESIVFFYNEAIPSIPVPSIFRRFAGRIVREMAGSLLEDMRKACLRWHAEKEGA